jgi:hypothetical protein
MLKNEIEKKNLNLKKLPKQKKKVIKRMSIKSKRKKIEGSNLID